MKKQQPVGIHENAHRKRDHIVGQARTVAAGTRDGARVEAQAEAAIEAFEAYLRQHGKRCTPERRFVVMELYCHTSPLDIETLHRRVCQQHGLVALTTIYLNLNLLVEAGLAHRLDLAEGHMAFYERTLGVAPHGYVVCQRCGQIDVLHTDELLDTLRPQLPTGFRPSYYNLQVMGLCHKCQESLRKQEARARKRMNKKQ